MRRFSKLEQKIQTIIFASGIDKELIGVDISGFVLKSTNKNESSTEILEMAEAALGDTMRMEVDYSYKDGDNLKSYLYFEKTYINSLNLEVYFESKHLINVLRLFKSSKIGFFHPFYLSESSGCGIFADEAHSYHSRFCFGEIFSLTYKEINEINKFFKDTYKEEKYNDDIEKMLLIFHESYRISSIELKLILRVIIFEMMIQDSTELVYRISRTLAVFLGINETESENILRKVKKIYTARSKYVHNGDRKNIMTDEIFFNTLDICRRIIANLLLLDSSKTSIAEIYEKCNKSGFGSNPFNIKL